MGMCDVIQYVCNADVCRVKRRVTHTVRGHILTMLGGISGHKLDITNNVIIISIINKPPISLCYTQMHGRK